MTSFVSVSDPSAEVFRDLAQIGAAVFIAFAISTATAATITGADLKLHLRWLGNTCGLGLTGFFGTLASVGLAAYRDAGHSGWLDLLGLFWVIAGIVLLGCLVATLPYATFRWFKRSSSAS
jgi:hypothetical protein